MRIDHIGLWASNLEAVCAFYATYFGAVAGPKYTNPAKHCESYFLTFPGEGRLEVMRVAGVGHEAVGRTGGRVCSSRHRNRVGGRGGRAHDVTANRRA